MWKKLAAMIAGSVLVSSCQTPMYKPIICEPGTALKDGRCQKVTNKAPKRKVQAPAPRPFVSQVPRQNVYGLPQL